MLFYLNLRPDLESSHHLASLRTPFVIFSHFEFLAPMLNRAREWGSELRAREGGQNLTHANSAPMKARISNFCGR